MDNEIWKDIPGYEGLYQISNLGRIKSLPRERNNQYSNKELILKQTDDGRGYLQVILNNNGKRKGFKVHKLVAQIFLDKKIFKSMPNENKDEINLDKLEVNHIMEFEKNNNSVDNLEWCTRLYNCNYGTRNMRVDSWKNGNRKRKDNK